MLKNQGEMVWLGMAVLVALVVRLLAIRFIDANVGLDTSTYIDVASGLMSNGYISENGIMPLYPLLIMVFGGGMFGAVLVDMIAGISSVVLVWALARCVFKSEVTGVVAAFMMAVYPMAIFYSIVGLTESLFVAFLLGAFLALYKNRIVLASVLFVLSILTRPVTDIFAPIVILWFALVIRKKRFTEVVRDLTVYGILYVIILAPWWYHNIEKYGVFVRLNMGAGPVLYAGNNPMNMTGGGIGGKDFDEDLYNKIVRQYPDPFQRNILLRDAAVRFIRQNPDRFFTLACLKFVRFWRFLPFAPEVRGDVRAMIATSAVLPLIILAIATLIIRRKMFWYYTPMLGFIAYLTLVHVVTIASVRYRFPVEPLLIVFAAPSLTFIWTRLFDKAASIEA